MTLHAKCRMLGVVILSNMLIGCVGAGLVYEHSREPVEDKNVNIVLRNERGYVHQRIGEPKTRKEDALRLWGTPDKVRTEGTFDVLVYRRELAFSGAFLVLGFIPIPLLAPVGYRHTHLYFSDDVLTKVIQESGEGPGVICGLMFDWSAGTGWSFHCGEM